MNKRFCWEALLCSYVMTVVQRLKIVHPDPLNPGQETFADLNLFLVLLKSRKVKVGGNVKERT